MTELKDINLILGKKIKQLRKEKKITREILAEKIEVSARFLADVESGKAGVSLTTLKKICISFNVSSDYLLGLSENKDEKKLILNSLLKKLSEMNLNTLKNLDEILNNILNIQNHSETPIEEKSVPYEF
ncbi:MAG: helix-turn-helix domain-containing protein [Firmicutes bacterium]|nr:helix-turn-helix domain-containing protein [Bacillota bacterium]